jgi:hypothetical protein
MTGCDGSNEGSVKPLLRMYSALIVAYTRYIYVSVIYIKGRTQTTVHHRSENQI